MSLENYFPVDCLEEIFRHLDHEDLLKCTEVCPSWNEFIGSTRSCMKKLKWFDCAKYKNKLAFEKSVRKYERLKLSGNFFKKFIKILKAKNAKWTQVEIIWVEFHIEYYFLALLDIIHSTVQTLKLRGVSFKESKINRKTTLHSTNLLFP